jgi:Protein of unknown function (DUF4012)
MKAGAPRSGLIGAAALIMGLGGILLWIAILAAPWRLASGLIEGTRHLRKAENALSEGATKIARYETLAAAAAVERARAGFDAIDPALSLARAVPAVDDAAAELSHLVRAAEHSADATTGTLDIAENALTGPDKIIYRDPETPRAPAQIRLDRVTAVGEQITGIRADVAAAQRELEAVDVGNLPARTRPDVAEGIEQAKRADALLADAEAGFALLPRILGADDTRTYLLAMQNSAELRGTGGAMLRFVLLEFDGGRATLLDDPQSVYKIDQERQQIDISLPEDAWYVSGILDAQRFGNANWSPDWPLTAELTLEYGIRTAELRGNFDLPPIDGIIGVDPTVMEELLKGAGRFETRGGRPITSEKVISFLLYKAYAQFPIPGERRALLNDVVDGFYRKVLKPERPQDLVRALGKVLVRKHVQIWMADSSEQKFIERMNWDAAIQTARDSNFLYVVQQNVGGNKLNYFEEQTHAMDVTIDGADAVTTTEVRIHNGAIHPGPRYVVGDSEGLHRPMVNVYVPADAQLIDAGVIAGTRNDVAAETTSAWPAENVPAEHTELGKKVWSTTLDIPPQQEGAVRFQYRVPGVVKTVGNRQVYRVVLQHQPKLRPETLALTLRLPAGAENVKARGWKQDDGVLTWERSLKEDTILEVSWRS